MNSPKETCFSCEKKFHSNCFGEPNSKRIICSKCIDEITGTFSLILSLHAIYFLIYIIKFIVLLVFCSISPLKNLKREHSQ